MSTNNASSPFEVVFLDTSDPLSLATQRRGRSPESDACRAWTQTLTSAGIRLLVPEIADYELRREHLRVQNIYGIERLDRFCALFSSGVVLVETITLREAARLWAEVRRAGKPTASDDALDGDAILCAQVIC